MQSTNAVATRARLGRRVDLDQVEALLTTAPRARRARAHLLRRCESRVVPSCVEPRPPSRGCVPDPLTISEECPTFPQVVSLVLASHRGHASSFQSVGQRLARCCPRNARSGGPRVQRGAVPQSAASTTVLRCLAATPSAGVEIRVGKRQQRGHGGHLGELRDRANKHDRNCNRGRNDGGGRDDRSRGHQ